tara:strand:- start:646 stop:2100 length:1455 start_codon:yes stop_codon:yes gene_type:complete
MAYTVNKTDGTILATVADGTINTTTDLTLIGKNYAGYGEFFNENLIKLLENFSNSSAPASPVAGQMWWDSTNNLLKVYTGTAFKTVSSSTASASQPSTNVTGDLWWDTTNGQLKVYNGSSFTTIGPSFTSGTGTSGAIVETVTDNGATDHVVVKLFTNNTLVGTVSKDTAFTPQTSITGFATVKPGIQLSTSVSSAKFQGTATDSDALGGVAAASYLRSDASDSTSGVLSILNDTGLVVGADSDLTVGVSGSDISISNATSDGDILVKVNDGGVVSTAMTVDGATNRVLVAGAPTDNLGIATKAYVDSTVSGSGALAVSGGTMTGDILVSGTVNFGSSGNRITTVFATTFNGTSTAAQYADLAENFRADTAYAPGTIVALGGAEEITAVNDELSDQVFGVVSSQPAYLMNSAQAGGSPVAVAGRVPVRVIGMVNKGDRLVSAGNGLARAANADESITAFNVLGRAIDSKSTMEEGTVEAFVTIN